jgi:thiamine pyrophosphate-dependent acetolactate synthase large subunit-like protein
MKRYDAIRTIVQALDGNELLISSNGMISRELITVRDSPQNFYMIGSMGLASSIGLGLAISLSKAQIVVIEGDGNVLMNMGSIATIGHFAPRNLIQVVLDNECHDSTGGQPTVSNTTRLEEIAHASGYRLAARVTTEVELGKVVRQSLREGPAFILVKVEKGSVKGIARVSHSPEQISSQFQQAVRMFSG